MPTRTAPPQRGSRATNNKAAVQTGKPTGRRTAAAPPADSSDQDDQGVKDVSASLAELDESWADTEEDSGFSELPDDTYQVQFEEISVERAKSSGRLQVAMVTTVMSGKYAGRKIFMYPGLDTEQNRSRFRGDLAKLGIPWPSSASELPELLNDQLVGTYAEVKLKENKTGDGQWKNIMRALDENEIEGVEEEAAAPKKPSKPAAKPAPKKPAKPEPEEEPEEEQAEEEAEGEEGEEGEEEQADEGGEGGEEAAEESEQAVCEAQFNDKVITAPLGARISKLAKKLGFQERDYATKTDLIADMAEHVGVSGTFANATKLVSSVEAQSQAA